MDATYKTTAIPIGTLKTIRLRKRLYGPVLVKASTLHPQTSKNPPKVSEGVTHTRTPSNDQSQYRRERTYMADTASQAASMERLTLKTLMDICQSHFRISSRAGNTRAKIYAALDKQPVTIQRAVQGDVFNAVREGNVKYTRLKRRFDEIRDARDPEAERASNRRRFGEASEREDHPTEDAVPQGPAPDEETRPVDAEGTGCFMVAPSREKLDKLVRNFIDETSKSKLRISVCGSCAQECSSAVVRLLRLTDIPNRDLLKPATPHVAQVLLDGLLLCREACSGGGTLVHICDNCHDRLKKSERPPLSLANDMWVGDVPFELQDLHLVERLMISKGFPSAYIVKLYPKKKGVALWGSEDQFYSGLRGNVTTYRMDPAQMASLICDDVFPHHPKSLSAVIGVTFVGPKGFPLCGLPRMFRVRRWRIRSALLWLKRNNPLYADITIAEERIQALPEDDVPEEIMLTVKRSHDVASLNKESDGYVPDPLEDEEEEDDASHPEGTILADSANHRSTESTGRAFTTDEYDLQFPLRATGVVDVEGSDILDSQLMAHALNNSASSSTLLKESETFVIRRGSAFVNEYPRLDPVTKERCDGGPANPNHLLGTFPTLFPYGRGGFETKREDQVPYEKHARWAMRYHDRRFRKDFHFPFQIFGVMQKREICRKTDLQMTKSNYTRTKEILATLKPNDMLQASVEEGRRLRISNPAVRALRENVRAVRKKVKGTDESRHVVRSKIWGTTLIHGPPCLWITINPSDTHDPIAQIFAGADIDLDNFCRTAGPAAPQRATNVAQDPYASAKFFHFMVKTIIEVLFNIKKVPNGRLNRNEGIFGVVRGYIGTVEAQGRGSLHLHMLLWLHDTPTSEDMQSRLRSESFRHLVAEYIEGIIKSDLEDKTTEEILQLPKDSEVSYSRPADPSTCTQRQMQDLENVRVRNLQLHNCSVTTCLRTIKGKLVCKRRAPFVTAARTWVDENGEWAAKRTSPYLNTWNPTLMNCVRANHDVKILLNSRLTRKITYYIGNYASKKQAVSSNTTALLARTLAFERQYRESHLSIKESNKRMIYRCANSLSRYREFSAPEIMSYIMGWGDSYESHVFVPIYLDAVFGALTDNFPWLKKGRETVFTTDKVSDPLMTVNIDEGVVELKDQMRDYQYRGLDLSSSSFMDFVLNTYEGKSSDKDQEIPGANGLRESAAGRPPNPRSQYLSSSGKGNKCRIHRTPGHETLPRMAGSWFPRNDRESDREMYMATMLAIFKPWRELSDIGGDNGSFETAFRHLKETADRRFLAFMENAQYYHSCMDDAREDTSASDRQPAQELGVAENTGGSRVYTDDKEDPSYVDVTAEDEITDSLIEFARAHRRPAREIIFGEAAVDEGFRCGFFSQDAATIINDEPAPIAGRSDSEKIAQWEQELQSITTRIVEETGTVNIEQLTEAELSITGINRIGISAPSTTLASQASTERPRPLLDMLNEGQRRAHRIIENRLIEHIQGRATQLRMLVLGPGGTGKSLLISAITETFEHYRQGSILAKCATTGIAATNIGGQTLHSWAALSIVRSHAEDCVDKGSVKTQIKRNKNIGGKYFLIVDEVSMEDKALSYDSSRAVSYVRGGELGCTGAHEPYGGMHVIKFGDFHQFPPVSKKGNALYSETRDKDRPKAKLGREIFEQFDTVVFLDEQLRVKDHTWTDILDRLRVGQCTQSDIKEIRKLVISDDRCDLPDFTTSPWKDAILVTSRHGVRQAWNEQSVLKHCRQTHQRRYIIHAEDFEKNSDAQLTQDVKLAIASIREKDTGKLEDVIQVAVGMRAMVQVNFAVEADIANGTRGRIEGIVLDERETAATVSEEGDTVLRYPPALILFRPDRDTNLRFEGVPEGLIPLTPSSTTFSVKVKGKSRTIIRRQYAMTPGYAFTDYKAQGQTINYVLIDLAKPPTGALTPFSAYVSLSRSRGRDTIRIIRDFDATLFQNHPSNDLRQDMTRLHALAERTKTLYRT